MKAGKEVSDPEMIRKYLTGEMGKFKCVNLYQDDSMDDNLEEQVKNLDEVILQMEKTGIISK